MHDSGTFIQAIIGDTVYIAQGVDTLPDGFRYFRPDGLEYHPFCDDFGPMNLSSIVHFICRFNQEVESHPDARIVYCVDPGKRALSNAVFLLGAYMVIKMNMRAQDVSDCFDWLEESLVENFRDATYTPADFGLTLEDCWGALERGQLLGWLRATADDESWGEINIHEYRHYDDPCNGDFHEVVPGKFIAFKGPRDLGGETHLDDEAGQRVFSPWFYAEVFAHDFNVTAVVRLNEAEYDDGSFEH